MTTTIPSVSLRLAEELATADLTPVIAAAGIAAVREYLDQVRGLLLAPGCQDAIGAVRTVALMADEIRRERRKTGGAITEARRQKHRAELLAEALADLLRSFPQLDGTETGWDGQNVASRPIYRGRLAELGAMLPATRRQSDWRRNVVVRTRQDKTNKDYYAAARRASEAWTQRHEAVELHRRELVNRTQIEAQLRNVTADRDRLAELARVQPTLEQEKQRLERALTAANARSTVHWEARNTYHRRWQGTVAEARRQNLRAKAAEQEADRLRTLLDETAQDRNAFSRMLRQTETERDQLSAELADLRLALSEQQGATARTTAA